MKPYQLALARLIWDHKEDGVNSGDAWRHLHSLEDEKVHKSRASVIFFFNDMVEDGIFRYVERTGKGGVHRVYFPHANVPCEEGFKQEMSMRLVKVAGDLIGVTYHMTQNPVE